ncbi:helix-turn-helix transcriptional regulator [Bradyrhizobium elkanii]|uniref:helix-turn-helix transcriptional regulator n=1 Tax=Bradyrhizobium elkanii TaxID=29448 RepID=UPI0003F96174|nr:helix-turn-helix transcriptional regulator [Bradyrhizobium elkanii]
MTNEPAMTPERFREALDLLQTSQNGFARFLNVDPRTIRRYASGELPEPTNIAILIELMIQFDVTPERAYRLAGLKPLDPEP